MKSFHGYDVKVTAQAATEQEQPNVDFTAPDEASDLSERAIIWMN